MTKTQTSDILQHLKDGRKLTQKEAINEYGAYRLSAIIHSLRKQGYNIDSIPLSVPTRYTAKDGKPRMANIVEYKIDNNLDSLKNDYSKTLLEFELDEIDEKSKKKEKVLTDIFNSDHQDILDILGSESVDNFMGYLDSITKTHSK
mgnify:FL=1